MARNTEKRSSSGTDLPLDLAPQKRFKFMIDHLLGDSKETTLVDNSGTDIVCIADACASNEESIGVCEETDDNTEEATQSEAATLDALPKTYPVAGNSPSLRRIECRLEGRELWSKFYELSTEMIITKSGRRMFPTMKLSVSGCDSDALYYILLDVVPVDNKRYRYIYNKSSWLTAGKAEPAPRNRLYMHPDSPFTGDQLSKQVISFEKAKLTNNEVDKTGHLILNSMHKYQPRIHIVRRPRDNPIEQSLSIDLHNEQYKTFQFTETQFMAVTAYQNQLITKLKIEKNPFAKGFRDPSGRSPEYDLDPRPDGGHLLLPSLYSPAIIHQALLNQYWMGKIRPRVSFPPQILSQMFLTNMGVPAFAGASATTIPIAPRLMDADVAIVDSNQQLLSLRNPSKE